MAEQLVHHLSQAGLDAEYWADILETKLNINIPQQIQFLDESCFEVLKDSIRQPWEEKALKKFLDINSNQGSNQPIEFAKSEFFVKLTGTGLDGKYWADVLKDRLGITRVEQTVHIQPENLKKLKDAVRYDWEEHALRKFFDIGEGKYEAFLAKRQELHKQQLEEANKLLADVVKLNQKGVDHTDDMMRSKLDKLQQLSNVPKDQWVKQYAEYNFDDAISKINSHLQGMSKLAEGRAVKTSSEILSSASAGLALRGILVGKDFSNDYVRRIVLRTPTDVTLMNPLMLQVDDVVHFSSKAQSDHFHHCLDTVGYSVAASIKGGGWDFLAEVGSYQKHENENEKQSESHGQTKFESRVLYSIVPTAACELNPYDLKLSQQALQELKVIDKLLERRESPDLVKKMCEGFLKSYGSHINAGILHFGGVYKFVATYTSEIDSESETTKSMVRDALSAYAAASGSGFGFSGGSSASADRIEGHGNFTGKYEKSEQAKIHLHTTRNGGPQEVSALPLWKTGVVSYNSTWALIDRGKTLSRDFLGIWKLIPNHEEEFQEPAQLASTLEMVWENMKTNPKSINLVQTLIKALKKIDRLGKTVQEVTSFRELRSDYFDEERDASSFKSVLFPLHRRNKYTHDLLFKIFQDITEEIRVLQNQMDRFGQDTFNAKSLISFLKKAEAQLRWLHERGEDTAFDDPYRPSSKN